ncbi:unnamed protein product [Bursaphelenchus xylophilus]|uniref:guanylate cyclase n=1 Tax=Bursaphelenchus xylophilus TaxID=6326 RepID=A0A1I7RJW0_BURXY|nr:unnamed protein product [Bursaphelenchus xylophilus]CAG9129102.1 unnamed protein product [Bursaphelenchus xylophilus]
MLRFLILLLCSSGGAIHLGLIENDERFVDVCKHAVADAKATKQCDNRVAVLNITECTGQHDLMDALDLHFKKDASTLVLGDCEQETLDLARLSSGFDFAVFVRTFRQPYYSIGAEFPNVIYNPDTAIMFMAQTLSELLRKLGLSQIIFIGPTITMQSGTQPLTDVFLKMMAELNTVNITKVLRIDENHWENVYDTVKEAKTNIKCVVIDTSFKKLATILSSLSVIEMGQNNVLVILLCRDSYTICSKEVLAGYQNSKMVVLAPKFENYEEHVKQLTEWIPDLDLTETYYSELIAIYDICYTYCYCTSQGQYQNRDAMFSVLTGKTLTGGKMGAISFDGNTNYIRDIEILQFREPNLSDFTVVTTARAIATECHRFTCSAVNFDPVQFKLWEEELKTEIPLCYYNGGCTNYTPLIIAAIIGLLGIIILGGVYAYQRRKRLDVFRMHWKIPKAQLKVIENKQSKTKTVPGSEDPSKTSNLVSKRRVVAAYALLGAAKAEFMVLKQMKKIRWNKLEMNAITELKRINHDNMTTFLGICYNEGDKFYVLHSLVERASLEDFINDQDFIMDTTFKSAFLRDIINGLQYLHKSTVGFHGLLNPANCLIDGNWVLKLNNFGLVNVLNAAIEREQIKLTEIIPFTSYYNTAPENLEGIAYGRMFPKGSRLGDIYSFGSLLFMVLFRTIPFETYGQPPKDIVEKIRKDGIVPPVEESLPEEKPLVDLMLDCWKKNPEERPKLRKVNQIISSVFELSKGNLIDQMIKMNYSYAQHLEKIVDERTAEFESQKIMNAKLLQQILPASIAELLITGESVVPRNYELASVLFCQLVDFNFFLSHTAPHNVIRFLNDVFSRFDAVIEHHDAYKVETTGETYMVASGVPNENDNRHVIEISEIALELRALCQHYIVEHIPNWKVQVRIGYHCGPIAAGVVGARAPRFCLFGDTVNFASRMQSNCPPDQIQLSEQTAERLRDIPRYKLTKRGIVKVKGKGDVNTYWLDIDEKAESIMKKVSRDQSDITAVPHLPIATPLPPEIPEETKLPEKTKDLDPVNENEDILSDKLKNDNNNNDFEKKSEDTQSPPEDPHTGDEEQTARIDEIKEKNDPLSPRWTQPPLQNGQIA